jgi:hypothetical protein
MTGYRMTDPFGQVRSRVCQLAVMVSVTVIGYMTGSSGHDHATAASYNCSFPGRSISTPDCHVDQTNSETSFSLVEYQVIDEYGKFSGVLDNVAGAITDLMHRYGTHEIIGESQVPESFVHIRWVWISLPMFLVLIGVVTLLLGVIETRESGIPVWKSSSLPLLCRGLYRGLLQTAERKR